MKIKNNIFKNYNKIVFTYFTKILLRFFVKKKKIGIHK